MRIQKTLYPYAGSLALHLIILFLLVVDFHFFSDQRKKLGKLDAHAVHCYLYTYKQPLCTVIKIAKHKAAFLSPKGESARSPLQPEKSDSKGNTQDALLSLLHAAIQQAQIYPYSALSMHREGRATLSFILLPDGHIQDLKLIEASGTQSLDDAALEAVRQAVPFQKVNQYLTQPHPFQIDVVFELPKERE